MKEESSDAYLVGESTEWIKHLNLSKSSDIDKPKTSSESEDYSKYIKETKPFKLNLTKWFLIFIFTLLSCNKQNNHQNIAIFSFIHLPIHLVMATSLLLFIGYDQDSH